MPQLILCADFNTVVQLRESEGIALTIIDPSKGAFWGRCWTGIFFIIIQPC